MANWYVNSVDQTQVVGSTVASQQVDLTITNVDSNGVHSGYNLSATNFKIGGATESPTNTWTGGNVDTEVAKVVFSDNGIAGDPANTVNAKVFLNSFTCPTAAETIFVDIDESAVAPALAKRSVCLRSHYTYDTNFGSSVAITDITDVTETSIQTGSSTTPGIYKHSGTVSNNITTKVAELTFTAATGYHYVPQSIAMDSLYTAGFDYSNQYIVNTDFTYTNNNVTKIVVKVFYTPPQNAPFNPDPLANMCELDHKLVVDFKIYQTPTTLSNTIKTVIFTPEYDHTAQQALIRVEGTPSAQYTIRVTEANSTTDSTISKYYNFSTDLFQAGSAVSATQTINANGYFNHLIDLPAVTVTKAYHIVIAAVGTTTLQSIVPDALDEAVINQQGFNTLTFIVKDENSVFGDIDTKSFVMPAKANAITKSYGSAQSKTVVKSGGNGNVSGTTITLDETETEISDGMAVVGLGAGTHGTNVTKVQGKTITVSKAVKVPDGTPITFEKKTPSLKEFSFTCAPAKPGKTQLSIDYTDPDSGTVEGRQPVASDIGGFKSVSIQVNGAVSSSATVTLDNTRGVVPGMQVTGTGISGSVTVSSVTNKTVIVLSSSQSLDDDTLLTFAGVNDAINIVDVQADIVDGKIVIEGYLRVPEIGNPTANTSGTTQAHLYVNDFIKAIT